MDWLSFLSGGFVTAFVTVLIEKVFDLWRDYSTRKAEAERHDEEQAEAYEAEYLSEKKKAYLEVLQWLAEIRHGFDVTRSPMGRLDSAIQKRIEKLNDNMPLLSARLRLYSSDEIYNLYWQLAHYAIFAYSPSNGPHIAGSAKDLFSHSITVLARMMQDDLGFREMVLDPEMIKCPNCGHEHDAYQKCDNCDLSCAKTFIELNKEQLKLWQEARQKMQAWRLKESGETEDDEDTGDATDDVDLSDEIDSEINCGDASKVDNDANRDSANKGTNNGGEEG